MGKVLLAYAVAFLFSCGLLVSGMTDPRRVLDFLDVSGSWNPALALVMGSAVLSAWPFFRYAHRRQRTWLGDAFQWPDTRRIDTRLILGAALFGLGWGVTGLCPAPALVMLASGSAYILVFVVSLAIGMRLVAWRSQRSG